jgi:hypothetical protein
MECFSSSSEVHIRGRESRSRARRRSAARTVNSEIEALRDLLGAASESSFAETIARCAPRFGPYLSQALQRLAAAFDRGEASPERARELADRLRVARFPAIVAAVDQLARIARGGAREEGAATRDALALCLAPLIALGNVRTVRGPRPFADALRRAAIIDDEEANVVFAVAKQFDRLGSRHYDTHVVLDELWSGARTPAALRRAIVHRARSHGRDPREHLLPRERLGTIPVPLVTVDDVRIGLAGVKLEARSNEIVIELNRRPDMNASIAYVGINGTATIGNARARDLAPWLIDVPLSEEPSPIAVEDDQDK